ncbi:Serine/threonine-protein kinase PknB [Pirellula sp. SH-Sr6A]|uniref:serine/threonine protein kinase n=1 Tax=Pirellula sp. SH-Sr6A TaxID=1632865 RepID=UPI00078EC660|nr:serine/threonine-protein kinase [Pirellula sp. SH-Sr6A]AMV30492.1 Serine/threonine-protein kinase PknB [Pirellula sp. SH-Sr6A]
MRPVRSSEKSIFLEALDIESSEDRTAFIESACCGDAALLASVTALLREHARDDNPVDTPIVARGDGPPFANIATESYVAMNHSFSGQALGAMIGPYKLMEQIGEGGFGLVYVADQQSPIRRRVALKIIKPGMESREVLTRFEAERQAIALMDHPNIARVFDAGVTESAQPYFVMELVRGVPLTDYCDGHQLDISERLKLFVDICNAVQHAHQKGIIHRDLKPSNILVTLQDGHPLVKVIDFGVAKAIGQSLTIKTMYTRFASMVGTPAYMSPEQAGMSTGDIDTRSDIYSLGVLLYELLTGTTPFASERLQSAGFDELRRIIREEEPHRPSTRLSTLNNQLATTIAANRNQDLAKLAFSMKRDLDWIVMKALDKDRNRRYATAGSMAEDVSRFLVHQPVVACPPSTWYRFSKFARRNKVAITTASSVTAALLLGTIVSVWQAQVAIRERDEKVIALNEAKMAEETANRAREDLEGFNQGLNSTTVLLASGRVHADAQRWSEAYKAYTEATEILPKYFLVWLERGRLNAKLGRWDAAAADFSQAVEIGCSAQQAELSGVPQLLFFTDQTRAYEKITQEIGPLGANDPASVVTRALLVGEISQDKAAELASLVEHMLLDVENKSGSNKKLQHKYASMYYAANLYVAGWAHLRAGNVEKAIERLEQSNDAEWFGKGIAHPLIAIAHHRAGRANEAVMAFEKSQALVDRLLNESVSRQSGTPMVPWIDWIELLLNHRNASIVVKGYTPTDDPRFSQMQLAADNAIAN